MKCSPPGYWIKPQGDHWQIIIEGVWVKSKPTREDALVWAWREFDKNATESPS